MRQTTKLFTSCSLSPLLVVATVCGSHAQVIVDVTKITCQQFVAYKIANPEKIAIWMDGYQNGTRGNTRVDTLGLESKLQKVRDYCLVNPDERLFPAIEKAMTADK